MKIADDLKHGYCQTFIHLLAANVDNTEITDEQFRIFVRNSLSVFESGEPGVIIPGRSYHDGRGPG